MKPLLYFFFLLICLTGCKKPVDILDPAPPGPITGELTPEQKETALTKAQTKFASLDWSNQTAAQQQLLIFLHTMPEFEEVGISEDAGNLWARFPDGELVILVNNRKPSPTNDGNGRVSAPPVPTFPTGIGLPASTKIVLMNAMGNYYVNGRTDMSSLNAIVSNRGYQVNKVSGTIDQLKQLQDAGVFYFSTHGGTGILKDSSAVYGLWVTDSASAKTIRSYAADLKEGNLCYLIAHNNQDRYGKPIAEKHLGITSKFVQKYMSFAENSLIYMDACESFTDNKLINAFLQKTKNTGTYFGWTGAVDDGFANKASKYFFDRTLGANDIYTQPENPNQRPFDPASVFADMSAKNLTTYVDPERSGKVAKLAYRGSDQHMTVLRPSISYMDVDESEGELNIVGFFGDDPGEGKRSVLVQQTEMKVVLWSVGLIVCKIPASGPGSAGDVVVKVGTVESNVRRLTEWRGTLKYRHPTDGSLYESMDIELHLRADVASFRSAPGQAPKPNKDAVHLVTHRTLANDSELWYSFGGYGLSHYESCTMEINREITSGEVPWVKPSDVEALSDHFTSEVEQVANGFTVNLSVYKKGPYSFTQTSKCPNSSPAVHQYDNTDLTGIRIDEFTLTLDGNYNIKADQKSKQVEGSLLYNAGSVPYYPVTLQWDTMKAQYPPLSTASLRQGVK